MTDMSGEPDTAAGTGSATRRDARAIPTRCGHRPGWHGCRVPGDRHRSRPGRRDQGAGSGAGRLTRRSGSASSASPPGRRHRASPHRPGVRSGLGGPASTTSRCAHPRSGPGAGCCAAKRPSTPPGPWPICGQLADALDAAHARGLIHRDVKPANVLLEDRGEEWAWLTDFGLTRRIGGLDARRPADGLVGTIDYMAPEAIEHGSVDGRADQYALACLAYHCLTGRAAVRGGLRRPCAAVPPPRRSTAHRRPDRRYRDRPSTRSSVAPWPRILLTASRCCRAFAAELRRVGEEGGGQPGSGRLRRAPGPGRRPCPRIARPTGTLPEAGARDAGAPQVPGRRVGPGGCRRWVHVPGSARRDVVPGNSGCCPQGCRSTRRRARRSTRHRPRRRRA